MGDSKQDPDGAASSSPSLRLNKPLDPKFTRPDEAIAQVSDASTALAADEDMEGNSGQRRRKNSLMKPVDSSLRTATPGKRRSLSLEGHGDTKLRTSKDGDDSEMSSSEDFELEDLSDDGLQDDEETGLTGNDRSKRRRRKETNTLLDHRIAGAETVTAEEKKEADVHVLKDMLINGALIGLWYVFSLSISLVSV